MTTAQIPTEGPKPTERQAAFLKANTMQAQNTTVTGALAGSGRAQRTLRADVHLGDNAAGAALSSNSVLPASLFILLMQDMSDLRHFPWKSL